MCIDLPISVIKSQREALHLSSRLYGSDWRVYFSAMAVGVALAFLARLAGLPAAALGAAFLATTVFLAAAFFVVAFFAADFLVGAFLTAAFLEVVPLRVR